MELLEPNNLQAGWSGFELGSTPLQSKKITDRLVARGIMYLVRQNGLCGEIVFLSFDIQITVSRQVALSLPFSSTTDVRVPSFVLYLLSLPQRPILL